MSDQRIRILIVDDHEATVQTLATLLRIEGDFEVVGTAADGLAAIERAKELHPDVILMDITMPGMDGMAATEEITTTAPDIAVVMLSGTSDNEHLRRSMNVGASYFLAKPVASDELYNAIRRATEVARLRTKRATAPAAPAPSRPRGQVIALFSSSGGVGRTTIAVNLAIALRRTTAARVAIADFSLPFGDVGVLLNAPPTAPTIAALVGKFEHADTANLDALLFEHRSGVKALLAPPTPEAEELIRAADVTRTLDLMAERFSYVVVDTWPSYGEAMLAVLDRADTILLPLTLELTTVKNARVFLEVAAKLGIDGKVKLVLNRRADPSSLLKTTDVEASLGRKVEHDLSSEEFALRIAMNRGVPILDSHADSRLAKELLAMAQSLVPAKTAAATH